MKSGWKTVLCLSALALGPASAADKWADEFSAPQLDRDMWCPCQINMTRAPVEFLRDADGSEFARITADINSLGGNVCRKAAPDDECGTQPVSAAIADKLRALAAPGAPKRLERKPVDDTRPVPASVTDLSADPYCDSAMVRRAMAAGEEGNCIQRQELRFQSRYAHPADEAFIYRLRFRMPEIIADTTHSVRWVTAQWKEEPISPAYSDPSPVLAQRFDDGVLHVTVQDGDCRCKIASAPMPDGSIWPARPGVAQDCMSTRPIDPDRTACRPELEWRLLPNPRSL